MDWYVLHMSTKGFYIICDIDGFMGIINDSRKKIFRDFIWKIKALNSKVLVKKIIIKVKGVVI